MSDTVGLNVNTNPYNLPINKYSSGDFGNIVRDGLRDADVGNVFDSKRDEVQREIKKGNEYLNSNTKLSEDDKKKLQRQIDDLNSVLRKIDKAEEEFEAKNEKAIRNAEAEINKETAKALKDGKITDGEFKKVEKTIDKNTGIGSEINDLRRQAVSIRDGIKYTPISSEFKPQQQRTSSGGGGYSYTPATPSNSGKYDERINSYSGAAKSIQNGINVIDGYKDMDGQQRVYKR